MDQNVNKLSLLDENVINFFLSKYQYVSIRLIC